MGKHSAPSHWSTGTTLAPRPTQDPDLQITTEFDVQELRWAGHVTDRPTEVLTPVGYVGDKDGDEPLDGEFNNDDYVFSKCAIANSDVSVKDFGIADLDADDDIVVTGSETAAESNGAVLTARVRRSRKPLVMATVPLGVLAAAAATIGVSQTPHQSTTQSAAHDSPADSDDNDAHVRPVAATAGAPDAAPGARTAPAVGTHAAADILPAFPASVTSGQVPKQAFAAYHRAAETLSKTTPGCGMTWNTVAGIGRVESHHADNGNIDPRTGQLLTPIYGPTLNGTLAGNEVITDTDGGRLDGDAAHDRAVGPMQFLPSTWEKYGADGNGDGKADPQNIYDAALTTAKYLCDGNLDMRKPTDQVRAILRYNNSMTYVDNVLGFARGY